VKNAESDVASNAVLALPRDVQVAPFAGFLGPGAALVVVTDGIGDPMGTGTGEVGQFLAVHWSRPPDLLAFAAHAAFYRRGFTDDRTAVAVWHKPGAEWPDEPDNASTVAGAGEVGEGGEPDEAKADGHAAPGSAIDPIEMASSWTGEEGNSD
jgi:hypothetical protein